MSNESKPSADSIPLIRRVILSGATFTALLGVLGLVGVIPAIPPLAGYGLIGFAAIETAVWFVVVEPMLKRKA